MGIHDRDYMQTKPPSAFYRPGRLTWILIAVNALLWIGYSGAFNNGGVVPVSGGYGIVPGSLFETLRTAFALWPEAVFGSGKVWQLVTNFWMHDPAGAQHLIFNMIALFFFGRATERWLGPKRFLLLYFGAGVFASLVYTGWSLIVGSVIPAVGASGAVYAVMAWLALQQPKSTVYLMMVIPLPMWLAVGVFIVGLEVLQFAGDPTGADSSVAHIAHLAGAAFGLGFWLFARRFSMPARRVVVQPSQGPGGMDEAHRIAAMRQALDGLLAKISEHGIQSLTEDEKAFLEAASRELR